MKDLIYKFNNALETIPKLFSILWSSVGKYKILGLVFAVLLATILVFNLKKEGTTYTGNIRFILKEKSGSGMGGVGGLLGSFGLGGQGKENFERLLSFVKTQRLQQDILLEPYVYHGDTVALGDAVVELYKLEADLEAVGVLGFKFDTANVSSNKSEDFKKASAKIGSVITGKDGIEGLLNMSYDRKSFIISIAASSYNEDLTIGLLHATYKNLEDFYSNDMMVGQAKDLDILISKKDSIESTIRSMENTLARLRDKTRGLVLNQDRTREGSLMVEIQMNYELLGELKKSAAMAEYSLITSDKGFLLLDEPIKPLFYGSRSFTKVVVFSLIFGLFGASLIVTIVNIFKNPDILDVLSEE
jgi:hypothetical protein